MTSLEEAVRAGQGIERPFRCHVHENSSFTASVNVIKGVWCCYSCGANGTIDGKKAPSVSDLAIMLEPERSPRIYADAYLELFDNDLGNFAKRFPAWLRWHAQLGCDPLTGDATFPVRTPSGKLAGVGRRKDDPAEGEPRYAYPVRWSASRSLFTVGARGPVLALVEGAADASAVAETGAMAAALYGSGIHAPQLDLVMRLNPKLVLIATDADDAGRTGAEQTAKSLAGLVDCEFVDWEKGGKKDPAETELEVRRELLAEAVVAASYGQHADVSAQWTIAATQIQAEHYYATVEN